MISELGSDEPIDCSVSYIYPRKLEVLVSTLGKESIPLVANPTKSDKIIA